MRISEHFVDMDMAGLGRTLKGLRARRRGRKFGRSDQETKPDVGTEKRYEHDAPFEDTPGAASSVRRYSFFSLEGSLRQRRARALHAVINPT